jgi:hypothetical protein
MYKITTAKSRLRGDCLDNKGFLGYYVSVPHGCHTLGVQWEVMVVNKREVTPASGCCPADCTECISFETERVCISCPKRDDLCDDVYGTGTLHGFHIVDVDKEVDKDNR